MALLGGRQPHVITQFLHNRIKSIIDGRAPDVLIDIDYMERWYLIPRNRFINIYAHRFIGSDAPTPHDHPWFSFGLILDGHYLEHTPKGTSHKPQFSWAALPALD